MDRKERSLDDRKLDYMYITNGAEPRSQTSVSLSYIYLMRGIQL